IMNLQLDTTGATFGVNGHASGAQRTINCTITTPQLGGIQTTGGQQSAHWYVYGSTFDGGNLTNGPNIFLSIPLSLYVENCTFKCGDSLTNNRADACISLNSPARVSIVGSNFFNRAGSNFNRGRCYVMAGDHHEVYVEA